RRARAYPYRAIAESGALMAFGSDAPVEPPEPAGWIHAAVTRQRPAGRPAGGFVPAQRMTLEASLACSTLSAARLAGLDHELGALRAGYIADLVVWNADLTRLAPEHLSSARPVATVLGGEVVHRQEGSGAAARPGDAEPRRARAVERA